MRVVVIGAGALRSLFGGLLAKAGEEVWLVGRAEHIQAVRDYSAFGQYRSTGFWSS